MINAVIIEDEKSAQEKLLGTLKEVAPGLNVVATLASVKESINYFKTSPHIDIIFCDACFYQQGISGAGIKHSIDA